MFSETMPLDLQTSLSPKLSGGLLLSLKLKKGALVIITTSIDLNDCVINGQFGTVSDFGFIKLDIN